MCRIDRRPDPKVPIDTLMRNGCDAVDTIQEVASLEELPPSHVVEDYISLHDASIDLSRILLTGYSVRSDEKARRYTLQRFNCYFFAWTILLLISHHQALVNGQRKPSSGDTWSPDRLMGQLATKCSTLLSRRIFDSAFKTAVSGALTRLTTDLDEAAEEESFRRATKPAHFKSVLLACYDLRRALVSAIKLLELIDTVAP
jgi:hypothetical protein